MRSLLVPNDDGAHKFPAYSKSADSAPFSLSLSQTTMMFTSIPLLGLCVLSINLASALPDVVAEVLQKRQSGSFVVTWPDSTVTWTPGNTYNVTWIAPESGIGSIALSTTSLESLVPLATDFNLAGETMNVTIPSNITTGGNYIILRAVSFLAESAPFGIGEAATTSASMGLSLDESSFRFSSTLGTKLEHPNNLTSSDRDLDFIDFPFINGFRFTLTDEPEFR
ncbi:hypothetical protein B0H17DRAFT_1326782 [Mycena rosella]|uniref:Uncharacterized protein n=1 Tax=Mycena rosella TaxID=1033263 RepID=A0AAD7E218_MYCRO|nr:hypothetical protein B0H17DRAFT_1326782 [Mycena rosella]